MSSRPRLGLDRWTHLTKDASNCYAVVGCLINTLKPPYNYNAVFRMYFTFLATSHGWGE